ncbi:transcriptional regulator with XRE-family HTH domain [Streptomyces pseudovenezuelae]|uniref:Transcriptional regulator with XRE-family HTH domain n=1 Tax=Streptomyces pseudovenezuelae TaxID=67350 RepID=A0ABT6LQD9_9ACTN|nr:transcriptional regulator with XRE-family HTH domain [Streptomyces pseudovenezuelae]
MPLRRVITGRSQEPRQRFAEELRLLRAAKGVSLRDLGEQLGWDWSLFGKLENGQTLGSPEVVQALDVYYGTPGLLLALWELAMAYPTQFRERYRRYMVLEAEAVSMWHYATSNLPGVLQTPAYARELLAAGGLAGEELSAQVEARMGRRELLLEDGVPPQRHDPGAAVVRRCPRTDEHRHDVSARPGRPDRGVDRDRILRRVGPGIRSGRTPSAPIRSGTRFGPVPG